MLKDPEKAQAMIDSFGDFKVPVFINGSIHGNEYEGTDAAIGLIETLAYGDTEEIQTIEIEGSAFQALPFFVAWAGKVHINLNRHPVGSTRCACNHHPSIAMCR